MKNDNNTKEQLLKENNLLKAKIAELEKSVTERKWADELLQKSETRYKNLYSMMRLMSDNLPDLIWTKDIKGKFLFVNKACSEILLDAKDTDEPIGKTDIYFAQRGIDSHPENPDYFTFGKKCTDSDQAVLDAKKPLRFDVFGYRMKKIKRDIRIETRTYKTCWEDHICQTSHISSGKI